MNSIAMKWVPVQKIVATLERELTLSRDKQEPRPWLKFGLPE